VRRKMLNFPAGLVLFSLSVLLLLPISAMTEGDGAWTTTASPGYIFLIEEDLVNNEKHMSMTVLNPGYVGGETYWGPASASQANTYLLRPLNEESDMTAAWQFNSVTQATVTVESCTTNCLWQPGQVVILNKFFGDMKADPKTASRVPKTGRTQCWDVDGNSINCRGTGQDGEYQLGVLPSVSPSEGVYGSYTVYGWTGTRFTDNGNGTVTDNLTGLIWLKNANCFGDRTWTNALSCCKNNLWDGSCGLSDGSSPGDWRLPNINELHSLVDPTQNFPALPAGHPFTGVQSSYYWSSTTYEPYPDDAWSVSMVFGHVVYDCKDSSYYVWPVRSGN